MVKLSHHRRRGRNGALALAQRNVDAAENQSRQNETDTAGSISAPHPGDHPGDGFGIDDPLSIPSAPSLEGAQPANELPVSVAEQPQQQHPVDGVAVLQQPEHAGPLKNKKKPREAAPTVQVQTAPEVCRQDVRSGTGGAAERGGGANPAAPGDDTKHDQLNASGETPELASPSAAFSYLIEVYRGNWVGFVEDFLIKGTPGFVLEPWQKDLLTSIQNGERRISVRAGHGVGKTATLALAAICFMFLRFPQKTVLTAPTAGQLFDALFAEITRWINELPPLLKDAVDLFSDRIVLKSAPKSSFMSARTSSAEKPEALAGVHSENVLLICDEASAIPEPVFEAAVGSMSGYNATTVLLGNPTRNSGLFFKTHHQLRDSWLTMHVSCLSSKLVSPDFVQQIRETYGEDSNAYRVRVLGEFSLREDDVLISAELVESAMARDIALDNKEVIHYGVDVARFGDDRTVLLKRQGNVVIEVKRWHGSNLMETVGRVVHEASIDKPIEIMVDSIGLGAGVADRLREQGLNVRDVNVSESSAFNPQAHRLRDELWITVKDWLAARACRLPKDEDLRQELCSPTYAFTSNGKIKVEAKADMKRRGMRSPDIADALCLTFAGQAALVGGRASRWVVGKALKRNIRGIV